MKYLEVELIIFKAEYFKILKESKMEWYCKASLVGGPPPLQYRYYTILSSTTQGHAPMCPDPPVLVPPQLEIGEFHTHQSYYLFCDTWPFSTTNLIHTHIILKDVS